MNVVIGTTDGQARLFTIEDPEDYRKGKVALDCPFTGTIDYLTVEDKKGYIHFLVGFPAMTVTNGDSISITYSLT